MAPVPVWKRMDLDQAVMQSNHDFIGQESLVIEPVGAIVDELSDLGGDRSPVHAYVLVRVAIAARPLPGLIEHAPMELSNGRFGEHRYPCSTRPLLRCQDIRLLPGEQFLSGANVPGNQCIRFIGPDRRCPGRAGVMRAGSVSPGHLVSVVPEVRRTLREEFRCQLLDLSPPLFVGYSLLFELH